jgi:addiction module RelE/StbE family toxin
MKLRRTRRYHAELRQQYEFLHSRNPKAAEAVVDRINRATLRLKEFPESGRSWRRPGTRELLVPGTPFIVIYRITDDAIEVLSLLHTAQDAPHVH